MMSRKGLAMVVGAVITSTAACAQDVRITTFKGESTFNLGGQAYSITRNQDQTATVPPAYALTSRACPPSCIQPMIAAPGVATFAELEVITFLERLVSDGAGLLVDARAPEQFNAGSIPGAVNVPHTTVNETNRFRADILRALGAVEQADGSFSYDNAMALVVFSDGPWSRDAFDAINHLIDAGYPPERLSFYRSGMQGWVQLGLTTTP